MKLNSSFTIIFLGIILFCSGCKKTDEQKYIGPIPESEFNSVPPPTYEQVIVSFDSLTGSDPSLLNDNSKLAIAIFNWVKQHPNGQLKATSWITMADHLTHDEWVILLTSDVTVSPPLTISNTVIDAYRGIVAAKEAMQAAMTAFPCSANLPKPFEDTKADAFRHAYWNILLTKRFSADYARMFATAHESETTDLMAKAMDLHNNQIGQTLAAEYPNATEEELAEILRQKPYVFTTNPAEYVTSASDQNVLIYFAGQSPYDGRYTGTITNPDSGGPWNIVFDLTECDVNIEGSFLITRDGAHQNRRFHGEVNGTLINLIVERPYSYEMPTGINVCDDMKLFLSGNPGAISGSWTSSNCSLGGNLTLSR